MTIVDGLLAGAASFASGDLVRAAKITRQAAHRHLGAFVRGKVLIRQGAGRGARPRRPGSGTASGSCRRTPTGSSTTR